MSIDLRCRHDRPLGELAANMFEGGLGRKSVADAIGVPEEAVRKWQQTYRAVGRGGLLGMGESHATYDFETKVAAASAVVGGGMGKPEAMARFGMASSSPPEAVVPPVPRGRRGGAAPEAQGQGRGGRARRPRQGPASGSSRSASAGSRRRWRT